MANPTMNLIASNTVGSGGASSFTFSSIPQTYTDLVVKISARDTVNNGGRAYVYISVNGASNGHNYTWMAGYGGSSTLSITTTNGAVTIGGADSDTVATANTFGNAEMYFVNYTGSTVKSFSNDGASEGNGTYPMITLVGGVQTSTSAITSIVFTGNTSFAQYSTFYLYGISNT